MTFTARLPLRCAAASSAACACALALAAVDVDALWNHVDPAADAARAVALRARP
jgi:hypothetical protein